MPQTRTAARALRKSKKRQSQNLEVKKDLRNAIKTFKKLLENDKAGEAEKKLPSLYKKLDMAATKNVIHKNLAARKKSRLSKAVKKSMPKA